jgi:hypothetical protein|tara:strand:+ start:701 stop:1198 length:498 start_codon:yes stop_codon:yes gene_type:complete
MTSQHLPGLPADPTPEEMMLAELPAKGAVLKRGLKPSIMLHTYQWDLAWFHLVHDHRARGNRWCNARCFASWSYSGERWSERLRRQARIRMQGLSRTVINREEDDLFVVLDSSGAELSMTLLMKGDDPELATEQLNRMFRLKEISAERSRRAEAVIERMTQTEVT